MRVLLPLRYTLPALLIVGALFIGLANYSINSRLAKQAVAERSNNTAQELHRIRNALEYALQRSDFDQARHILSNLGADPDITLAHLTGSDGTIIASTRMAAIGNRYTPPAILSGSALSLPRIIIEGNTLYSRHPVALARAPHELRPTRVGQLYVEHDLSQLMLASRQRTQQQSLAIGGFLIITALALWFYLHTVVARRIARLQGAARRIGDGMLTTRVELSQGDELGMLAQHFNTMAEQIEDQHSHLRALQQALDEHAIVSIADISGRIVYVNDRFCAISQYSREELLGQNHRILKSNAHPPEFYADLWRTISGGRTWHGVIQNRRKDGKPCWVQSTIVPILDQQGTPAKYISVRTDLTQRERLRMAMEQLATAATGETSYDTITRATATGLDCRWAGFALLTADGRHLRSLSFYGDGKPLPGFQIPLEGTPCADICAHSAMVVVNDNLGAAYPASAMFERLGAVSYRGAPLIDETGSVTGAIFTLDDKPCGGDESGLALLRLAAKRAIQEIRRTQINQMLLENQQLLSDAQRLARLGSWTLEFKDNHLTWSDEVFRILEIDQLKCRASYESFLERIHPDDRYLVRKAFADSVERRIPYSVTHRLMMEDGRVKWVHERGETFYGSEGKPQRSIGYIHDISERKAVEDEREHLQKQLQQAQKMESIGQLTGGIAHDFNNILTSINGFIELSLLQSQVQNSPKLYQYLSHALQASERARALVAQMLAFGRSRPGEHKAVDGAELIHEVVRLLRHTLPSSLNLKLEIQEDVPPLLTDTVQLHQVLTNMVINARDAVSEYGTITLALKGPAHHHGACSSCHQNFDGDFIEIVISDDGHGIPAELRARVFEPFFTTKQVGKGSGMGLAMVHGIIHHSQGHIVLESPPGAGTSFHLLLPAASATPACVSETAHGEPAADGTGRNVMVVDDEQDITLLLSELLGNAGHRVTTFNNPQEALNAFRQTPGAYDLVITDQTMPVLTGAELSQQLLALRPGLPIILCSGYSTTIDAGSARTLGIHTFLPKPLDSKDLMRHVEALLQDDALLH